ncbi:hypothetical protein [Clostridium botulinum]|uniref:hypothetical protein n=1 Tax=Clostridium botulinum TaxID=1491 RepID=UPI003DA4AE93
MCQLFFTIEKERANIIGTSLRGWISLKFAIDHPIMVEKLVLISPSGIGGQKSPSLFIQFVEHIEVCNILIR